MTISPNGELHGVQTPRFRCIPDAESTAGPEATALVKTAGIELDPWQRYVLDGALGERADGRLAATEVVVVCPRQNGKNSILEAAALNALFLWSAFEAPKRTILWTAHQFKTCQEAFRRVTGLVEASSWLKQRVKIIRTGAGDEAIELHDGSRIRFIARSRTSGRGFSPNMVILDEAFELDDDALAALLPSLAAKPNHQIWYTSSAPHPTSTVLRRVCKRGRQVAREGRNEPLAYFEWCADSAVDSGDVNAWLDANPGIGYRLTTDFTAQELGALDDEAFRRERLGIWHEEEFQSVISMKRWRALHDKKLAKPTGTLALAIDMTPDRSQVAIAAAIKVFDGRTHVEVIDHHPTIDCGGDRCWCEHKTVLGRVKELAERHEACVIVLDARGAAASMAAALKSHLGEDRVHVSSARQMADACGLFYDAVMDEMLHHLDQFELNDALKLATKRELGDAWAWSRKGSDADISPLVAATLANYGLSVREEKPKKKAFAVFA